MSRKEKYAIVTDGLWRKSLSVIRSLGRAGYKVTVLGDSYLTIGFWSRYTTRRVVCPTAGTHPQKFEEALLKELTHPFYSQRPVLFPMEDPTMMWLSENRNRVASFADFTIPSEEALDIAEDKGKTMKLAESLSIPHPHTFHPTSYSEAWDIMRDVAEYPVVLKPTFGTGSAGIVYCERASDISESILQDLWEKNGSYIVQERVPAEGDAIGVNLIYDKGSHCVGHFVHKRLQQYPISGGPSTDRISITDDALVKRSKKLLDALSWKGVAMLEWKKDPSSGVAKLLEINPRFWGSLELATRSGIDFPILYADVSRSEKTDMQRIAYDEGVRCRWLIPGDILRYLSTPQSHRESVKTFLSGLPTLAEEWDVRDIPGFLATIVCTALLAIQPKYWKYVRR